MSSNLINITHPSSASPSEAYASHSTVASPIIYTRTALLAIATSPLSNTSAPPALSSFPEIKRKVRRSVVDAYKTLEYAHAEVEHKEYSRPDTDSQVQAHTAIPNRKHKRSHSGHSDHSTSSTSTISSSSSVASLSPRTHTTLLSSPDLKSKSVPDAQASLPPVWKANVYIPPARRALGQTQPEVEQRSRALRPTRAGRRSTVWRPLVSAPAARVVTVGGWQ